MEDLRHFRTEGWKRISKALSKVEIWPGPAIKDTPRTGLILSEALANGLVKLSEFAPLLRVTRQIGRASCRERVSDQV